MAREVEFEADLAESVDFTTDPQLDEKLDGPTSNEALHGLKQRGREMLGGVAERGRARLVEAAEQGRDRVAERLSHGVEYLRSNDIEVIRDDLVSEIRRRPVRSLVVAVGTGYVLGRVLSTPIPRLRRRKPSLGEQISRAVISGAAAVIAAKVQARLMAEEAKPARRRSRKRSER
ncbi:MAG: hypothetical protein ACT443_01935 [Gemmatimonadota bacterium]